MRATLTFCVDRFVVWWSPRQQQNASGQPDSERTNTNLASLGLFAAGLFGTWGSLTVCYALPIISNSSKSSHTCLRDSLKHTTLILSSSKADTRLQSLQMD